MDENTKYTVIIKQWAVFCMFTLALLDGKVQNFSEIGKELLLLFNQALLSVNIKENTFSFQTFEYFKFDENN